MLPKEESLGHEKRYRTAAGGGRGSKAQPFPLRVSAAGMATRQGQASGALRAPLTGPVRAGRKSAGKRKRLKPVRRADNAPMDVKAREQYLADLRAEYAGASRAQKTQVLNEAEKRTGLHRKTVISKLNRNRLPQPPRDRPPLYGAEVKRTLANLWELFDFPCGQRLAPLLREQVPRLRATGQWPCADQLASQLARISAKTIDRLLAPERRRMALSRGRRKTSALLASIPVKLSDAWDRRQVGNVQIDYVLHCGQSTAGCFLRTLSAVDIATGWWEGQALTDTLQASTESALEQIRRRLPFVLREIHPDNDSGFLNERVLAWCERNRIAVSRSRALRKNDNCWVEQKNFTHVRKLLGYHRMEGHRQQQLLARIYAAFCDWRNFFLPVMRLASKIRDGSKVHRRYDQPRTPYQRLLDSGQISGTVREQLQRRYARLDPFVLRRRLDDMLSDLFALVLKKAPPAASRRLTPSVASFLTQRVAAG